MQKFILFSFLFFLSYLSFGQHYFKPGYIIQRNDTITGLIDQRGDQRSGLKVTFKASEEAAAQTYTPQDINGYGIQDGYKYETKTLGQADSLKQHFFTLLVKGNASLYFFRDANSNNRFFIEKADSLQELTAPVEIREIQGKRVAVKNNLHRAVLRQTFQECAPVTEKISKLPLKESELIEVTVLYNQCQAPTSLAYVEKPKEAEITWGISAGGSSSSILVEGRSELIYNNVTFNSSLEPIAGIFVHSSLPWLNPKVSVQLDLLYHHSTLSKYFTEQVADKKMEYDLQLDYHYLKVPLMARYTFVAFGLRPFLTAGVVNSYALKYSQQNNVTSTSPYQANNYQEQKP